MELHTIFSSAEMRKEEHRKMLEAVERERSSRIVMYLVHSLKKLRVDARGLWGARRLVRLNNTILRRVRYKA